MFWTQNPSVLIAPDQITQVVPSADMPYSQKMNALARLVFIITVFAMLFFNPTSVLLGGFLGELVIIIFFKWTMREKGADATKEALSALSSSSSSLSSSSSSSSSLNPSNMIANPETNDNFLKTQFSTPTKKNPFGNVLLTDIGGNPKRKPAPPAFNNGIHDDIDEKTKAMVQQVNPSIKDVKQKLFGNVGDNLNFEQSQRNFYSTANTRVNNDQGAFANWLYGSMISGKESDPNALLRGNPRHNLY